jgi:hypothetical protein
VDYAQRIEAAIGACDAVVVLIGRDWLEVQGPDGRRRLDDPDDVLRREITAALARDILIIPVLVEGATMPSEHTLPSDIAPLARRNGLELSDTRWDYDDLTDLGTVQDLDDGQWQRLPARRDDRAAGSHRPGGGDPCRPAWVVLRCALPGT